jgi:hypothetical protein
MSITVDVRPEVEAELPVRLPPKAVRREAHAASLLEEAAHIPLEQLPRRTGQAIIDAFAEIRGLLTDEEIDRMFMRNPSGARPVELS